MNDHFLETSDCSDSEEKIEVHNFSKKPSTNPVMLFFEALIEEIETLVLEKQLFESEEK